MPHKILIHRKGETYGPYDREAVEDFIQEKRASLRDWASLEGSEECVRLEDLLREGEEREKLFESVPVEEDTQMIVKSTEKHEGYDVRFEVWRSTDFGYFGKSLVFKAEDVAELDDAALRDLCRRHSSCPDDEKDKGFTISRDRDGYTFVNFGFEKDDMGMY